jgi:queuosine precursor transporter
MAALILAGSILSYIINGNSRQIAVASFLAFICSACVDTIVYSLLGKKTYMMKVNGSNVAGSVVDSMIFPFVAFGGFFPIIMIGQFIAKVLGGYFWSLILRNKGK